MPSIDGQVETLTESAPMDWNLLIADLNVVQAGDWEPLAPASGFNDAPAEVAEAIAAEVTDDNSESAAIHCDVCSESVAPDDAVTARDRYDNDITLCAPCAERDTAPWRNRYCSVEYRMPNEPCVIHAAVVCTAIDTDETATHAYANRHWHYDDYSGGWYTDFDSIPQPDDDYDDDDSDHGKSMYEYHSTDVLRVHGWPAITPKTALCFGVELEMECDDSRVSDLCAALGDCSGNGNYILMSDGSLSNGTELITLPYTLEEHRSGFGWKKILAPVQDIAKSGAGTTNCGMHVHINRKAITPLTLGKMLVFVNSPANIPRIKVIAQRDPASWAAFKDKKITDGRSYSDVRYEALNVGGDTVEVRIFRGNLRPERVLKNIEFCHALVTFARDSSITNLSWDAFVEHIGRADNRKTYSNLIKFIKEKMASSLTGSSLSLNDSEEL